MRTRGAAVVGVLVLCLAACTAETGKPVPVAVRWFDQTAAAVRVQDGPDLVATRTWALAWWAADRAVGERPDGPAADAALAVAVHDVLVALLPERREGLDDALAASPRDAAGRRDGAAQARAVLEERSGDGVTAQELSPPYAPPRPSAGTWRPTPPERSPGQQSVQGRVRPFLLARVDAVRPGPPAPLGSAVYRRDLEEVRRYGEASSTTRSPEQTATARLWEPSTVGLLTGVLRDVVMHDPRTVRSARLLSVLQRVSFDAQVAVYDAKYAYARWRPVTALQVDDDGDPATPQVAGWEPLIPTPPSPEYPSGHTGNVGAVVAVLTALVGPAPPAPVHVAGRTYTSWQVLVQDDEDARVWSGVHLRGSDLAGTVLGRRVAAAGLRAAGTRTGTMDR